MKKTIAHIILFLSAATLLAACTDQSLPVSPAPESGRVVIVYSISGTQTRATEDGWNEGWNENLVNSLYLLVMRRTEVEVHGPYNHIDPQNGTYETLETDLDVAAIAGCDSVYLVANCPSVANIETVQQLQEAIINPTDGDPTLTYNGKQTLFAMDATIVSPTPDADGNMTLTFDLVRAAAKIRLTIYPQGPDGIDIQKDITYRACNFATSTHLLAAIETYDNFSSWTNSEGFTPVNNDQIYQTDAYSPQQIVFYSYPNDWFDTERLIDNGNGTYTIQDMHTSPPIVTEHQTYLLICAPYNGEKGYYKIPVNHQLPDDSDLTSFTENQYKNEIRPLYRLERNHFYDISVTIDSPGGPIEDPVIPDFTIRINDWTEGGDYTLSPDDFV